ncbi:MAG: hypothetical protein LBT05_16615 [Planctomycetaceae bacterium]|nr:hypothetical protein [Planctomycetaceae bacterium]
MRSLRFHEPPRQSTALTDGILCRVSYRFASAGLMILAARYVPAVSLPIMYHAAAARLLQYN